MRPSSLFQFISGFLCCGFLVWTYSVTTDTFTATSQTGRSLELVDEQPTALTTFLAAPMAVVPLVVPSTISTKKVFHFLKEAGLGIGNMQPPPFWDDVDNQRNLLIVDVGACDGVDWSVPAVQKRGHTVVAFEPVNAGRFRSHIAGSGLQDRFTEIPVKAGSLPEFPVSLQSSASSIPTYPLGGEGHIYFFESCVSNDTSKVTMFSSGEMASLVPQDFYDPGSLGSGQNVDLPSLRLDTIIAQDVHLLKIDTQGNEYRVLLGAQKLFENYRVNMVELEFWPKGMAKGGANAVHVLEFLHSHGFICFDYARNKHVPANRPSDFEGFVQQFLMSDDKFGLWDELLCYNVS
jgi:FkbM family methyltransferase